MEHNDELRKQKWGIKSIVLWLAKNISRWAWKTEIKREKKRIVRDDAKMCVSEAQMKRYQYRWHLASLQLFSSLLFHLWRRFLLGPLRICETEKSFSNIFAPRCQRESMNCCKEKSTNTIGSTGTCFSTFFAPTFSLMLKWKWTFVFARLNSIPIECSFANSASDYWFFLCELKLHVGWLRMRKNLSLHRS